MSDPNEVNLELDNIGDGNLTDGYHRLYEGDIHSFANTAVKVSANNQISAPSTLLKTSNTSPMKINLSQKQISNKTQTNEETDETVKPVGRVVRSQSFSPLFERRIDAEYSMDKQGELYDVKRRRSQSAINENRQRALEDKPNGGNSQIEKQQRLSRNYSGLVQLEESSVFSASYLKTAPISDFRKKLAAKFKCTICHNPFNDPRVLDCLHTFCLECIFDVVQMQSNKNSKNNESSQVHSVVGSSEADLSGLNAKKNIIFSIRFKPI